MTDREKLVQKLAQMMFDAHKAYEEAVEKWIINGKPGKKPQYTLFEAEYFISHGVTVREPGRWISRKHDEGWGWYILLHCDKCDEMSAKPLNYCPNCGAKMEGKR